MGHFLKSSFPQWRVPKTAKMEKPTIGQNDKNRILQYGPDTHFEARVSACGTIEDNQAHKLDKKEMYIHVYIAFNVLLIGNPKVLPMLLMANRYNMKHEMKLCRNSPNMSNHVSCETLY